ncbi:nucleoside triphosphate pyrophosphatase [Alkalihalobacillus sp. AL-G]|uniref:Maf family protein n=1 Tax=Alkalihalobacillus sp. AL-G TaxID=2926399 RepID=UPI00272B40AF|nr:Maf family protein [Alkalihalobacillus sp. AL-G]WLD92242.1 Maf family protein [Alkalihalobacillus sp. AL-G]
MNHLILASGSPRRKELLEIVNLPFTVQKSSVHENITGEKSPAQVVEELALRKAQSVHLGNHNAIVLGADTIVAFNGRILGKPKNEQDAVEMISMLSGKQHTVYTGVSIVSESKVVVFHEATDVTFWKLTKDEIEMYVRAGESMDKAGSYGIQGIGATLVRAISGDYYSVVGLPIARTVRELKAFGITQDLSQSRN